MKAVIGSWRLLSRGEKNHLSFLASLRVLSGLLDLSAIYMVGLVGAISLGQSTPMPEQLKISERDNVQIIFLLTLAASIFLLKTVGGVVLSKFTFMKLARIERNLSADLARLIFRSNFQRLRSISRPDISWALIQSSHVVVTRLLGHAINLLTEMSLVIMVFVVFIMVDWQTALGVTVYLTLILFLFQQFSHKSLSIAGEDFARSTVEVNQVIEDYVNAYREIMIGRKSELFLGRFERSRGQMARAQATELYLQSVPRHLMELGLIFGAVGFLAFQILRANPPSDYLYLGIYLMGSVRLMSALLPLQRSFMALRFDSSLAISALEKLETVTKKSVISSPLGGDVLRPGDVSGARGGDETAVRLESVSFFYNDARDRAPVLDRLTMVVPDHKITAIVGPSGSGKSTLVDLMLGIQAPSAGTIACFGMRPQAFGDSRQGAFGYVPQKPGLISGSILENIVLGEPPVEADLLRVEEVIHYAGLTSLIESLPEGIHTPVGKHLDSLSGGQLQRIGLARALYPWPKILVLDEATSGLDAEAEASIVSNLRELRSSMAIIVIAHRLSTVKDADFIHFLDGGTIQASGTFRGLKAKSRIFRGYLELLSVEI